MTIKVTGYLFFALISSCVCAQDIRIAVASNFKPTLEKLIEHYPQRAQQTITFSSASTGVLAAQISQGAPFDLLLAADAKTPQMLASQLNLTAPKTYALGSLAFWCPQGAPKNENQLKHWRSDVALAASQLAPYGKAAEQVIQFLNWPEQSRVITATNIAQVSLFVHSGAAPCGFVAQALLPNNTAEGDVFLIPTQWHSPIEQQALLIHSDAEDFLTYLLGPGQTIINAQGYASPGHLNTADKGD